MVDSSAVDLDLFLLLLVIQFLTNTSRPAAPERQSVQLVNEPSLRVDLHKWNERQFLIITYSSPNGSVIIVTTKVVTMVMRNKMQPKCRKWMSPTRVLISSGRGSGSSIPGQRYSLTNGSAIFLLTYLIRMEEWCSRILIRNESSRPLSRPSDPRRRPTSKKQNELQWLFFFKN